jgi:hypothetical protein
LHGFWEFAQIYFPKVYYPIIVFCKEGCDETVLTDEAYTNLGIDNVDDSKVDNAGLGEPAVEFVE